MIATVTQKLTFDQFLVECPEDGLYELVNGEIVEMNATRNHDDVANFMLFGFNDEIRRKDSGQKKLKWQKLVK